MPVDMPRRLVCPLLFVAALVALYALTAPIHGSSMAWLVLAPAMLLALPLLAGRYVGERALQRRPGRRPRRARGAAHVPAPRAPEIAVPQGGLLLARRICGRAPPPIAAI